MSCDLGAPKSGHPLYKTCLTVFIFASPFFINSRVVSVNTGFSFAFWFIMV